MNITGLNNVADYLKTNDIAFTCVTSTANVFYLTGFYCEPHERFLGLFVFAEKEPILVCPNMEANMAIEAGWNKEIIGYSDTESPFELIQGNLKDYINSNKKIAVEEEHLTLKRYNELKNILPDVHFVGLDNVFIEMRSSKNEDEIKKIKSAAAITDLAIEVGVKALKEGITEVEVLSIIENTIKENGVTKMPFNPVVLFGRKSADPHGQPDETTLKKGDFVLFDIGAVYEGYCSDITRTFVYGNATEKQKEIYEAVLQANLAGIDTCKVGKEIANIDQAARQKIEEYGFGEYFIHRTGHGIGIDVHEPPYLHSENRSDVKEGMAVTVEPGIYIEDLGGVRIEDDVIVTESSPLVLTKYPKELQEIK